ncbi:putative serine protease DO-like protein [Candidatus Nitrososphaera gargensis Ga9.2]|uniref:Putative serine protease DO-like protein n=1 Tax=Nitrososphaera gargensis (strain Ga9.2) TaxID=1237085 RepID=K0IL74_NITGG|nr:trypsin-like peptidase domain-containing protein [Candidatus Nitrososphaera gargensis]AFU60198.1 putative serine protease DO-like protein [Candidatus Nitrososphaera gargensis Ga9.2]
MSKNNESPSSTLTSLSDAIISVAEKVSPSVVGVQTGRMFGGGSGVIWSNDGYIVTCYHVVKGFKEVQVSSQELGSAMHADVVGKDPYSDIAILKISNAKNNGKTLQPIEISDSEDLKAGQMILALANPFGEQASITKGIITSSRSSVRGRWRRTMMNNVVITDARLNPGYSGGPLVDASGKMIGLNAFYISSRGIAIRTSKVKGIVENLKSYGRVRRAYLGITSYSISIPEEVAKQAGINQDSGLMVVSVEPNSPAKKAGLLIGDVVLSLDGKQVESLHDIEQLLTQELIGKAVKLVVLRSEKLTELTIVPDDASH